ncbi:P-loop containing nucleoside triphosphate hydrolase protein, partial [Mycena olivaceomarginata]
RLNSVVASLRLAVPLLNELNNAFGAFSLHAISETILSLIAVLQNVKKNKVECIQLVENIHQVLYAIINLHIKLDTPGSLPPSMLYHVGKFTETIHKIHTFLEAQQDGNRIKNLFRQSELNTLVKDCRAGLQHAMEVFKIESGASIYLNASIMQKTADNLHKELLEMISSLSDGTDMDKASSMHNTLNSSQMSSESFSMLPSKPKIFYGRESELASILKTLDQECARITILGPGGMGKTSLARAVLHHADVTAKYEHRFFVSCDSATTSIEIAALIGDHIGLKPGKDLTQPLLRYFAGQSTCLLILDNLETVWEPMGSRVGVEELLSLLTDIAHLALLITMRGAERPAKVRWTRPFLEPLKPLSDDAAQQIFLDIADDFHEPKDIQSVLNLTNNMPLAVDLIAHLVDNEGCPSVLARWETEKTGLLSVGHDRRSNIDTSIRISLSSPRLISSPGAMDLLRLLSVLPDGLSDIELLHSDLAIQDILTCKVVLLSTSLAYQDDKKQLKSLVPIREHMQHFHPPPSSLIQSLQKYFHTVLDLYEKYRGSQQMATSIHQIKSNFGNLNQILLRGLHADNTDTTGTIMCVLNLASFSRLTGREWLSLMDEIPNALPQPCNHKL